MKQLTLVTTTFSIKNGTKEWKITLVIIKEGNLEQAKRKRFEVIRFECSTCGCIFDAEKHIFNTNIANDFTLHTGDMNNLYAVCQCPTCGETLYKEIL